MAKRGINQVELAKLSGIKQPLISNYLRESKYAKFPSLKTLIALGTALKCGLDELTGLKEIEAIDKAAESADLPEKLRQFLEAYEKLPDGHRDKKIINTILDLDVTEESESQNNK